MHRSDVSLSLFFFWLSLGAGECDCRDEIQRIKAGNPDISHREAFSAAAKNWAHFPHIHFGLMPDHQGLKKTSLLPHQDHQRKDGLLKDGLYAAAANMGVAPY